MKSKTFLFLVLIILSINGWSQKDTSKVYNTLDTTLFHFDSDSGYVTNIILGGIDSTRFVHLLSTSTLAYRSDTSKVMMLCCDTTFIPDFNSQIMFGFEDADKFKNMVIPNRIITVFWLFGYIVTNWNSWDGKNIFLDENKKPLKKSIVVWNVLSR